MIWVSVEESGPKICVAAGLGNKPGAVVVHVLQRRHCAVGLVPYLLRRKPRDRVRCLC